MRIKEPNVWKLNFLLITSLLKPRKSVFCFSAPPLPPPLPCSLQQIPTWHLGIKGVLLHHNKTKATVPETGKDTGRHRFPPGRGVGFRLFSHLGMSQLCRERVRHETSWCLAARQFLALGACGWIDRLLHGSIWGQSRLGRGLVWTLSWGGSRQVSVLSSAGCRSLVLTDLGHPGEHSRGMQTDGRHRPGAPVC